LGISAAYQSGAKFAGRKSIFFNFNRLFYENQFFAPLKVPKLTFGSGDGRLWRGFMGPW
jgi:hypothetical protein